ncbi:MAG: hypothetical protein JSV53_02585 [candidate division WOR-3 bacterium]|nr:MAG: hypothetical protein JSV53_02585 [candidate division WOR-3 bacterium]
MEMKLRIPRKLTIIGGTLIAASGLVNTVLGMSIHALYYDVYPGGKMGHVGIFAGIVAVILGLLIVFVVVPLYNRQNRSYIALGGILTVVLGHLGAVAGAIYIGTLGLLLCYIAGFWAIALALFKKKKKETLLDVR